HVRLAPGRAARGPAHRAGELTLHPAWHGYGRPAGRPTGPCGRAIPHRHPPTVPHRTRPPFSAVLAVPYGRGARRHGARRTPERPPRRRNDVRGRTRRMDPNAGKTTRP